MDPRVTSLPPCVSPPLPTVVLAILFFAVVLANRLKLSWRTKSGLRHADYVGSMTQSSTVRLGGSGALHEDVYVPFSSLLPMVHPDDLIIGGWDVSKQNIGEVKLKDSNRRFKPTTKTKKTQTKRLTPKDSHQRLTPKIQTKDSHQKTQIKDSNQKTQTSIQTLG